MSTYPHLRIGFIGGGTMAEAFVRGLLREDIAPPDQILVGEPVAERRDYLASELGVATTGENTQVTESADITVLAIKPQVVDRALPSLSGHVKPSGLILSIVAGLSIARIHNILGADRIVRVMPNTPAQIGEGISVWTCSQAVEPHQTDQAKILLCALGQEVHVDDEHYLDMATALSGSGPGYVFLFIEALIDAGVQMGFSRPVAERLVLQTVRGSAAYAQASGTHSALLRNRVTSPGGTTAAGIYELEKGRLRAVVTDAVLASYKRARALGGTEDA